MERDIVILLTGHGCQTALKVFIFVVIDLGQRRLFSVGRSQHREREA